jgi:hypothetical protein
MNATHFLELDLSPARLRKGMRGILVALAMLPTVFLPMAGCKKTVDDATLNTNVKAALSSDAVIAQQPIQVATQAGVVTLTGNVSDETASSLAAQDTAKVTGVKEVVNSLTIAGLAVAPTITAPSAPTAPRLATRTERVAITQHQALPPPPENAPAPPQPVIHNITLDAGTSISIRITESLSSETAQPGMPFSGVTTRPIVREGFVVIPAGASVRGTVSDAKDATHFKGSSMLAIRLESVRRHGVNIPVSTEAYVVEGKGRGVNTAEKIGGGAAIGAVLGGIFGGGKGAAIGAGAGAGGGTILQGATRGQQVSISSESVIPFRLASPITVQTAEQAADVNEEEGPGLQTH